MNDNDDIDYAMADGWHVAISRRFGVASQGNSLEEAAQNLLEAIELHEQWPVSTVADACEACSAFHSGDFTKLTFRVTRFKLENAGFDEVRQLGNHAKFVRRDSQTITTAVLPHYIELAGPVLASIVRQSCLEPAYFFESL